MSVISYLETRAGGAVLNVVQEAAINTSITTIRSRLDAYFEKNISSHFRFGSSTRGTILPRSMDADSDIDYMVVFTDSGYTPQTYLDRLRRFAEKYYASSDIKQSSPTITLELNHIKFDLVPALKTPYVFEDYQIPKGPTSWQSTNPNDFNAALTKKNNAELSKIKPMIRLLKFWNARAGYVYDSYMLEKWVVQQSYPFALNLRDYLFTSFDALNEYALDSQWQRDRLRRAKEIVAKVRKYEADQLPVSAEVEVKKLIPEF